MDSSFRIGDRRFQEGVLRLLEIVKSKSGLEKEITDALADLGRHLAGEAFGVSEALRQEHLEIRDRVCGFQVTQSPAFRAFQDRQLTNRKFPEILSICEVLAEQANVTMDRESKRRKQLLFRWLDANWDRLAPCLDCMTLVLEGNVRESLAS
jgi:hypothetical protein